MISQDSSDSVVKDVGVKVFVQLCYPAVTALLESFDPTILHLFGFAL